MHIKKENKNIFFSGCCDRDRILSSAEVIVFVY